MQGPQRCSYCSGAVNCQGQLCFHVITIQSSEVLVSGLPMGLLQCYCHPEPFFDLARYEHATPTHSDWPLLARIHHSKYRAASNLHP